MKKLTLFVAIAAALILSNQAFTDSVTSNVSGANIKFAANDAGVGEVKTSLLKPEDFARIYGPDWQLLAPRDVSALPIAQYLDPSLRDEHGKFLLPDSRGKFIRVPNNGASGANFDITHRVPGSYQNQAIPSTKHKHPMRFVRNGWPKESGDREKGAKNYIVDSSRHGIQQDYWTREAGIGSGTEVRVKNIALNLYVRVDCTTGGKCTNN